MQRRYDRRHRRRAPCATSLERVAHRSAGAAVVRLDAQENGDLRNVDLASGISSRLTTRPADDTDPSWSPDERALAFMSRRAGVAAVL
jgi:Tol biopolymer transport system component